MCDYSPSSLIKTPLTPLLVPVPVSWWFDLPHPADEDKPPFLSLAELLPVIGTQGNKLRNINPFLSFRLRSCLAPHSFRSKFLLEETKLEGELHLQAKNFHVHGEMWIQMRGWSFGESQILYMGMFC